MTGLRLRSSFSFFWKPYDAFIPASIRRGKDFCFGFVRFGDKETTTWAVEGMNGRHVSGRGLTVKEASFGWSKRAV